MFGGVRSTYVWTLVHLLRLACQGRLATTLYTLYTVRSTLTERIHDGYVHRMNLSKLHVAASPLLADNWLLSLMATTLTLTNICVTRSKSLVCLTRTLDAHLLFSFGEFNKYILSYKRYNNSFAKPTHKFGQCVIRWWSVRIKHTQTLFAVGELIHPHTRVARDTFVVAAFRLCISHSHTYTLVMMELYTLYTIRV